VTSTHPPVAYVLTQHPRTTQTFINAEIDALRRSGHEVDVFALNEADPAQIRTDADRAEAAATTYLKAVGVGAVLSAARRALSLSPVGLLQVVWRAVRSAGTDGRRAVWRLFHLAEALIVWDRSRERGVEVVHAHFGQSTSTVAWLATTLGRVLGSGPSELVVTVHCGTEVEDAAETIPALKARDARAIVAISDHTRSQLMRHVPAEYWSSIRVIRCGIDLRRLALLERRPISAAPTILFVGRLDPVKGVPFLLEAVGRLRDAGRSVDLEIVGGGSLEAELRAVAADASWVRFTGELPPDAVHERLLAADVFCLPSLDEGIPVSIMEAMAVGTPVVATAVAGIPELAIDERTALVVPAGNVDDLVGALGRMLDEPALVERLRRAARQRVESLHDSSTNLPALIELLTERRP
jgi:colanic acid/amylovoran biosynthesis glycosyltransferase